MKLVPLVLLWLTVANAQPLPFRAVQLPIGAPTTIGAIACPALRQFTQQVFSLGGDMFSLQFVPNAGELTALGMGSVDFVDVHYSINSALAVTGAPLPQVNLRMTKLASGTWESRGLGNSGITLRTGDTINYFFTYCIGMGRIDCNTDLYTFTVAPPAPVAVVAPRPTISCPVLTQFTQQINPLGNDMVSIQFTPNAGEVMALGLGAVMWIDVHYSVNAPLAIGTAPLPQVNLRMVKNAAGMWESMGIGNAGISVPTGQSINYFFTYCIGMIDCNTIVYTWSAAPAAVVAPAPTVACPALTRFTQTVNSLGNDMYSLQFIPNADELNALGLGPLGWVDVHYSINAALARSGEPLPQINLRMIKNANGKWESMGAGSGGISLAPGQVINYFFTYCINGRIDCNTELYSFTAALPAPAAQLAPAPTAACPALRQYTQQAKSLGNDLYSLQFVPNANELNALGLGPLGWVDVHYSINAALALMGEPLPQINLRMVKKADGTWESMGVGNAGISLPAGSTINYFFTYCINGRIDCNTELFTFSAAAAVVAPTPAMRACPALTQFTQQVNSLGGDLYSLQFVPNANELTALGLGPLGWVDVHFSINAALSLTGAPLPQVNLRMVQKANGMWESMGAANGGISLPAGQTLNYFFTYCINGVLDCNTQIYTWSPAPAAIVATGGPISCPALTRFTQQVVRLGSNKWSVQFLPSAAELASLGLGTIDFVDLHLAVGTGRCSPPQLNYRMTPMASGGGWESRGMPETGGIVLSPGTTVNYFFTYCIGRGRIDCDTDCFSFTVPNN